jgi:prepilin-type N-terminal cleavage/methylation domain-containing protein/prepilin-type processing-associated H-X9-DG protein
MRNFCLVVKNRFADSVFSFRFFSSWRWMMQRLFLRQRSGFTLVELLVVIAIIGVLVALLLPAVQAAREAARRSSCSNNLKQLALGCLNYEDTYKRLPLNYASGGNPYGNPPNANFRGTSWLTQVLPFIEQQQLYDIIDFNFDLLLDPRNGDINVPNNPSNAFAARQVVPAFICPSDGLTDNGLLGTRANRSGTWAVNNYKGVAGANWGWGLYIVNSGPLANTIWGISGDGLNAGNGVFFRGQGGGRPCSTRLASITDGTSNTFMIGEAIPRWCTHTYWTFFNGSTATCAVPLNANAVCQNTGNKNLDLSACWEDWPNNYSFMSLHPGGGQFALADGSVRFVSETIDLTTYRALGSMMDGQPVNVP